MALRTSSRRQQQQQQQQQQLLPQPQQQPVATVPNDDTITITVKSPRGDIMQFKVCMELLISP